MPLNNKTLVIIIVSFILIVAASIYIVRLGNSPGKYDNFAKCLTEKGAEFYGAFWCPHCRNQKKLFGKSIQYVNYIECSTPDGNNQLKVCIDKDIKSYPTWLFADGSLENGELSLERLAEKTNCLIE